MQHTSADEKRVGSFKQLTKENKMGAVYVERKLVDQDVKSLKARFKELQEQAAWENGNSYSGDINMAPGLDLELHLVFESYQDASQYLENRVQKWESALAVKYKYKDKRGVDKIGILIGALCSS